MKSILHPKFFGLFVLFLITTVNASLHEEVQAEIRNQDPNAHVGIMVYSLSDKKVLYEHQADKLFVPASVSKVVTAASALHHLGDNYRFTTQLLHDGVVAGNTLKGNLYLKGDGDPSLTSKDLAQLAKTLRSRGIKRVTGQLRVDASVFDDNAWGPGRMLDDDDCHTSGLNVNFNSQAHPKIKAGQILRQSLTKHGVAIRGKVKALKAPANAQSLAKHQSGPLSQLIGRLMKISDNLFAESLFKKVASKVAGTPGTHKKGSIALHDFLSTQVKLAEDSFVIGDGCGLSRYSLITPGQLTKTLEWAYHSPHRDVFLQSLPISGIDGCLKGRLMDLPNKVRAKTGRMTGIAGLSGFFNDTKGNPCAFSILINNRTDTKRIARRLFGAARPSRIPGRDELDDALCKILVKHF